MTPIELLTNAYTRVFPFTTAINGAFAFFLAGFAIATAVRVVAPAVHTMPRLRTATVAVLLSTAIALTAIGGIGVVLRIPTGPNICMCYGGNSPWYR